MPALKSWEAPGAPLGPSGSRQGLRELSGASSLCCPERGDGGPALPGVDLASSPPAVKTLFQVPFWNLFNVPTVSLAWKQTADTGIPRDQERVRSSARATVRRWGLVGVLGPRRHPERPAWDLPAARPCRSLSALESGMSQGPARSIHKHPQSQCCSHQRRSFTKILGAEAPWGIAEEPHELGVLHVCHTSCTPARALHPDCSISADSSWSSRSLRGC